MKLLVKVVPRHDFSFVIEQETLDVSDDSTIYSIVCDICGKEVWENTSVTALLDCTPVPFSLWRETHFRHNSRLVFILEPQGEVVTVAFVLIAMVASFVYSLIMLNRLNSVSGQNNTAESRSIYDVNAQGNKVKLGDVVPEQFGLFKKFPDYLADPHTYYKDNEFYLDLILSQGVGYFQHDINGSDLYVGSTPVSVLTGVQFSINDPGADLSQNTIDPEITKCWYNSTEVTASGHTIHALDESSNTTIVHLEYRSIWIENFDFSEFQIGDILELSGIDDEWVVIPALQNVRGNRPRILALGGNRRRSDNYGSPYEYDHPFAISPVYQSNLSGQYSRYNYAISTPSGADTYHTLTVNSAKTTWSQDVFEYQTGFENPYKPTLVYLSECAIAGQWSSPVTEDDGLYVANSTTRNNWNKCNLVGTSIARFTGSYGNAVQFWSVESSTSGIGDYGDAGNVIKGDPLIYSNESLYITAGSGGSFNANDYTFTLNSEPWNKRFRHGSSFTLTMRPGFLVKVTKCPNDESLVNKWIVMPTEQVNTYFGQTPPYTRDTVLDGEIGGRRTPNRTTFNFVTHLVFHAETWKNDITDWEWQLGWHIPYNPVLPETYTPQDMWAECGWGEVNDNPITTDPSDEMAIDIDSIKLVNLTRLTCRPQGHWECYDSANGIVDDNGYYKVVGIYGGGKTPQAATGLSRPGTWDKFSTPFGFELGSHSRIDNYCPNEIKIQVVRCDRNGNEIADWDGFWNCVSQHKNGILRNLSRDISSNDSTVIGPYRAAPIGVDVSEIEVDITAPSGVYKRSDSGKIESYEVICRIEYKRAGDLNWQYRDVSLSSKGVKRIISYNPPVYEQTGVDAVGITEKFNLSAGDWYFRVYRLTEEHNDDTTHYADTVKWTGLKSVIANPQAYSGMTSILMRFRGNETLSELSDNQISTIWTRKLPDIVTGELIPTSNLAPAVKYICDNSKFASYLSIENLEDMDAIWNCRGLCLNGTLDTDNTLLQVLRDILHIGYSELSAKSYGLEIVEIAKHDNVSVGSNGYGAVDFAYIFSPQNYKDLKIDISLPRADDAEEIAVEYIDPKTYKTATVYLHIDGTNSAAQYGKLIITNYATSIHQEKLQTFGVVDREQAIAMGARRLRQLKRQRIKITLDTEFEGLNCGYKDFVGVAIDDDFSGVITAEMNHYVIDPETPYDNERLYYFDEASTGRKYTYSGRIVQYASGIATISPPLTDNMYNSSGNRPVSFFVTDDEGTPYLCYVSSSDWLSKSTVRITIPFQWTEDSMSRIVSCSIVPCWIEKIKPSEKGCTIELVNYDSSVFANDLPIREGYGVSEYGYSPYGMSY